MVSKQKQSSFSGNNAPSEYVKNMEKISKLAGLDHQNAIVFSVLLGEIKALEKKLDEYSSKFEKLESTVDWIGNYVEEKTGVEPGQENSSDSYDSEEETIIISKASIPKKKRKYPGKKKVK